LGSLSKDIKPIIKKSYEGKISYKKDPMKYLLKNDLATQIGNGLFVLKGPLVDLISKIEELIFQISKKVNAEPVYVPCILSYENADASEYLNSFNNQALLLKTRDAKNFEGLACPTVCYHYFSSLKNKSVNNNFGITALSRCSRKEEGLLNDLSRLTNFTMREIVFYGTEKYCKDKLKDTLNETEYILQKVFDLDYKVMTASDPFFGTQSEIKRKAQLILESKYEIQATLPFNNEGVSIASFNNHGKVFFERFNIRPKNPELSYSGCVGWGYERILFAILAQKGLDFDSIYYKKLLDYK
jgi:seryl-tRNA synthetase